MGQPADMVRSASLDVGYVQHAQRVIGLVQLVDDPAGAAAGAPPAGQTAAQRVSGSLRLGQKRAEG
jgi:hypothetical protein